MLSEVKRFFREYGSWQEPYRDYLFFGKVTVKTVHETLLLKDYEIVSNHYLFGKRVNSQEEAETAFRRFLKESREVVEIPPDHYLSSVGLLLVSENPIEVSNFFERRFIWFGIKGKVLTFGINLSAEGISYPEKLERESPELVRFLNSLFKASRV